MTPEIKRSLIIGGGLILAVVLGIVVYKKYEANSQTSQAASDQASQDELAYIESMALSGGAYASYGGGAGSAITIPSAPATQSLADEIAGIEQAFGFAPASSPSAPSSSSSSTSSSSSSSSSSSPSRPLPTSPLRHTPDYVPVGTDFQKILEEPVGAEGSYVA